MDDLSLMVVTFVDDDDDRMMMTIVVRFVVDADIHDVHKQKMKIVDLDVCDDDGYDGDDVEEEGK